MGYSHELTIWYDDGRRDERDEDSDAPRRRTVVPLGNRPCYGTWEGLFEGVGVSAFSLSIAQKTNRFYWVFPIDTIG
jgi:hypothetical protein